MAINLTPNQILQLLEASNPGSVIVAQLVDGSAWMYIENPEIVAGEYESITYRYCRNPDYPIHKSTVVKTDGTVLQYFFSSHQKGIQFYRDWYKIEGGLPVEKVLG